MKLSFNERGLQRELAVGLIGACLFAYFFDPLVKFAWNSLSKSASFFAEAIQDSALRNAAFGQRNWIDAMFVVCSITAGLTVYLLFSVFRYRVDKRAERNNHFDEGLGFTDEENLRRHIATLNKSKLFTFLDGMPFRILAMFFLIGIGLWFAFLTYVDLQLNTSFNQRVAAIAPYIEPIEEKKLRSLWALMETQKDYSVINKQIEAYAIKAGIRLPPLLYK